MQKSETIGELAKALCILQGKLTGAKKDSVNPFFKAKYADLASVWDACRGLLSENGLSVVQTNSPSGENTTTIDTTMLHNSGEWISSSLEVPLTKNDPQGLGSAMTYARRYGLSAIVGVCPEDDDAESATKREPAASKPIEKTEDKTHWCEEHNTDFFKTVKMKSYAHPIKEGDTTIGWCYEHTTEPVTSKSEPLKLVDGTLVFKDAGELKNALKDNLKMGLEGINAATQGFDLTTEQGRKDCWATALTVTGALGG